MPRTILTAFIYGVSAFAVGAEELVSGEVELVAEGYKFTEGPLWLPSGTLIFSDTQADTIYRGDNSVYRSPSGSSNGLTLDRQGRLILCEQGPRRVTRIEADGTATVLADTFEGARFHGPNDVIVRSDGTVFFTDPSGRGEAAADAVEGSGVYALEPDGVLTRILSDAVYPNGLALSPDEKTLYVADTMKAQVRAFDLDGVVLGNGRELCKVNIPDGLKVDVAGNIWITTSSGVVIVDKAGEKLNTVKFPQWPANCAFGGPDSKTLYVTARTKVYKIRTTVAGIRTWAEGEK